jgi:hypothetical protein
LANLQIQNSVGYNANFTGTGANLSILANEPNGYVVLNSNFTFSGNYTVTVDVSGLETGTANNADAG